MSVANFLWGSGGRRMTPEDIARERQMAGRMMQTDYSPIQSPWQGLARVSENLVGALRSRRADRASTANADDQRRIIEALMNPGGGAPPVAGGQPSMPQPTLDAGPAGMGQVSDVVSGLTDTPQPEMGAPTAQAPARPAINPAIIQALTSPYVSDEVRALATMQYRQQLEAANRRPLETPEFVQLIQASGVDPASPEGRRMVARDIERRLDPIVSIPLPGGRVYTGPRSGMPGALGNGGGAPPATLPPDFEFPEEGGPQASSSADDFPW